jgi:hypothetical protein
MIDVFDMERIDGSLGEDLKTKFEIIASSYKFRKPGSLYDSPSDITVVEDMCELNSSISLSLGLQEVSLTWS